MELFVFHRSLELDKRAVKGGVSGVVVDLERYRKDERQQGYDTQINSHGIEDLRIVKEDQLKVICRINEIGPQSEKEINTVISTGADEILVPMVRSLEQVDHVFRWVRERAGIGLMIETPEAVALSEHLDKYPLSRVFIGLNDLQICLKKESIFHLLAENMVDLIRERIKNAAFGFGGLTLPGKGDPLPVDYFFSELDRLDCDFTFLRRSFFRDTKTISPDIAVSLILNRSITMNKRSREMVEQNRLVSRLMLEKVLGEQHNV